MNRIYVFKVWPLRNYVMMVFTPLTAILFIATMAISYVIGVQTHWLIGTVLAFGAYWIIRQSLLKNRYEEIIAVYFLKYALPLIEEAWHLVEEETKRTEHIETIAKQLKQLEEKKIAELPQPDEDGVDRQ